MMKQGIEFFSRLIKNADCPACWHCGQWSSFQGSFYIVSDLLTWSAYFRITVVILRYISKKQAIHFLRLYFLLAAFSLACDVTQIIATIIKSVKVFKRYKGFQNVTASYKWIAIEPRSNFLSLIAG